MPGPPSPPRLTLMASRECPRCAGFVKALQALPPRALSGLEGSLRDEDIA